MCHQETCSAVGPTRRGVSSSLTLLLLLLLLMLKECIKCENIGNARKGDPQAGIAAPVAEAIVCIGAPAGGEENLGGV